jgi:hypothetical protein
MVFCYGGLGQSDRRERKLILRETFVDVNVSDTGEAEK